MGNRRRLEARGCYGDFVLSDGQELDIVDATLVGDGARLHVCRRVGCGNTNSRENSSSRVHNGAAHGGCNCLSTCGRQAQQHGKCQQQSEHSRLARAKVAQSLDCTKIAYDHVVSILQKLYIVSR